MVEIQSTLRQYMEWGIKLKNNLFRKTFINFIIKSIVAGVVILLGTLTLIYITSQFNFHWLYDIAPSLYYLLSRFANYIFRGELIILLMFIVWLVYVILNLYRMIRRFFLILMLLLNLLIIGLLKIRIILLYQMNLVIWRKN